VVMPTRSETLEALKSLEHASPAAVAKWCVECGRISILDVEEIVLAVGDLNCRLSPLQGTPQQCVDAFAQTTDAAEAGIQRLRTELAALDDLLSRPTSNNERGQLLAERQAKANALDTLTKN